MVYSRVLYKCNYSYAARLLAVCSTLIVTHEITNEYAVFKSVKTKYACSYLVLIPHVWWYNLHMFSKDCDDVAQNNNWTLITKMACCNISLICVLM